MMHCITLIRSGANERGREERYKYLLINLYKSRDNIYICIFADFTLIVTLCVATGFPVIFWLPRSQYLSVQNCALSACG